MAVLDRWAAEAAKEVSSDGNRVGNIPTLGVIHAYMALILSNQTEDTMTPLVMGKFLGAMAYVRGRHAFGQVLRNIALNLEDHADQKKVERVVLDQLLRFLQSEGVDTSQLDKDHLKQFLTGEPLWYVSGDRVLRVPLAGISKRSAGFAAAPAEVPEYEIFACIQRLRRPTVNYMSKLSQEDLDTVLNMTIQVSMSAPAFNYVGWKHGADLGGQGGLGVFIAPTEGITVDVQAAEVLYRNAEIKPVPDSMSAFADFETVFGKEALQCAWRFHHKHRKWVEIIGENHELLEWDEPSKVRVIITRVHISVYILCSVYKFRAHADFLLLTRHPRTTKVWVHPPPTVNSTTPTWGSNSAAPSTGTWTKMPTRHHRRPTTERSGSWIYSSRCWRGCTSRRGEEGRGGRNKTLCGVCCVVLYANTGVTTLPSSSLSPPFPLHH